MSDAAISRAEDPDQRVILDGIDWWQFETFLAIRGDRAGVRVTYLEGQLEILRSSRAHEWLAKMLSRLLEAYADEKDVTFEGYKSMTLRNAPELRGIEPDECYAVGAVKESPDLAVEVIWTHGGIDGGRAEAPGCAAEVTGAGDARNAPNVHLSSRPPAGRAYPYRMRRKLLVVYVSRYGQTEKIARRIGEVAQQQGIEAEVLPAGMDAEAALAEATDVVAAGGIYFGRPDRALFDFVQKAQASLATRHTALVTVCGAADDRKMSDHYVRKFLARTGWKPDVTAIFAGATSYTRYGWLVRFMMRRIALSRGAGADPSRDYEYTDWNAVEAFARSFVAEAQPRVA